MDVARADAVDADLEKLIARRASQDRAPDPLELEPGYRESVRRHNEAIRRRNRAAWFSHFCNMARSHARIAADYERRAEELCSEAKEGAA